MYKRFLGFRKTNFGYSWKCDLLAKITKKCYNPLIIRYLRNEKIIQLHTPYCNVYDFKFI